MAKLSLEKKTELVAHYMGTTDGYIKTARVFGVSKCVVKMLVAQYKINGVEGLSHKKGAYSGEFKEFPW